MLLPLIQLNDAAAGGGGATVAAGSLVGGAPLGGTPLAASFKPIAASAPSYVATVSTDQAQTVAATSARTINATAATAQAQTVAASAIATVNASASTAQAQTVAATSVATRNSTASTAQAQTVAANAAASINSTATTSQAQTVAASASAAGTTDATVSTSQAQTTAGTSDVIGGAASPSFDGGFVLSTRRKVYVRRGKSYLIFNNHEEADAYINAEAAIETAKKSSRGAAKRVIKALKVVKPEIAPAPQLQALSELLEKFNIHYDLIELQNNNDIDSIYQIQYMLYALQQDEDDIELLLLSI